MARYEGVAYDAEQAVTELTEALQRKAANPFALNLANDLRALLPGWRHFTSTQRAVLRTAVAYLIEDDDAAPDEGPGGLADDDAVVGAAIRVLLRRSRR